MHDPLAYGNVPALPAPLALYRLAVGERSKGPHLDRMTKVSGDFDIGAQHYIEAKAQATSALRVRYLYLGVEVTPNPKHSGKVGGGGLIATAGTQGWAGAAGGSALAMPQPQAYASSAAVMVKNAAAIAASLETAKLAWEMTPTAIIQTAHFLQATTERAALYLNAPWNLFNLPELKPNFAPGDEPKRKAQSAGALPTRAARATSPERGRFTSPAPAPLSFARSVPEHALDRAVLRRAATGVPACERCR